MIKINKVKRDKYLETEGVLLYVCISVCKDEVSHVVLGNLLVCELSIYHLFFPQCFLP
jgi:hypothetical protein